MIECKNSLDSTSVLTGDRQIVSTKTSFYNIECGIFILRPRVPKSLKKCISCVSFLDLNIQACPTLLRASYDIIIYILTYLTDKQQMYGCVLARVKGYQWNTSFTSNYLLLAFFFLIYSHKRYRSSKPLFNLIQCSSLFPSSPWYNFKYRQLLQ